MKIFTSFLLILAGLFLLTPSTNAQVLNSSFENDLPQGGIQHWTNITLFTFPGDSLMIDSALYFRNSDPHTGKHALELRNGFQGDTKYAGNVQLTEDDSTYQGFAQGMSFTERPKYFTFFYKFFPATTDDTARATISLINGADGEVRGSAEVLLTKWTSEYTEAVVPIEYTGDGQPTNLFIEFSTRTANSTPSYGTRFLVDDVGLRNTVSSVQQEALGKFQVSCSPNPATNALFFKADESITEPLTLSIFTLEGKQVEHYTFTSSLAISSFNHPKGSYFYSVTSEHHAPLTGKFVVN